MIRVYTALAQGQRWLEQYQGRSPLFACILGFTATGLIPGISAAGATPHDREYTAIADAEFLLNGRQTSPQYPLPPLDVGASPVLISRAVVEYLPLKVRLFNAGLLHPPAVPVIDLQGKAANCVSSSQALPLATVEHLFAQGYRWGTKLGQQLAGSYLIIGECVVGGTTTALAILTGLGYGATGKVNSSHPCCNHQQKWAVVKAGLQGKGWYPVPQQVNPLELVAAVGDPMQIVAAGMIIAASNYSGVLLAGGTQMLAVAALSKAIADYCQLTLVPEKIVVGTTRWVAEDPTGNTVGLAREIGTVALLATQLSFANSKYPSLRAYEQGYVKEGVGAGGCAIAAHLTGGWNQEQLLSNIESLLW